MPNPALPVLGITCGDPAGIGPDIIASLVAQKSLPRTCAYRFFGARTAGTRPGRPTLRSARIAWRALEDAFAAWQSGDLAGIVTGPIQKETMQAAGFPFPGHTEFFARRCGFAEDDAVMVMTDPRLTVALCTTHCSLRDAIRKLRPAKVVRVAMATADFLARLRRRPPRLALAGLNPHAGENGLFGNEEIRVLAPALAELRRRALDISGPHSPDTVFHHAARGQFDAVVCAYHDQGLIPFKLLAFTTGVNITLGLPLLRTSPDHGTALDLAGTDRADPRSFLAAIRLAAKLASHPKQTETARSPK